MNNQYEAPDVIQIAEAQSLIRGTKWYGIFDVYTNCEFSSMLDLFYDIDE